LLTLLTAADDLLHGRRVSTQPGRRTWIVLVVLVVTFGVLYGLVMGGYQLLPRQMIYSALKVPLLLFATFAMSLPSFFVVGSLLGLRPDLADALRRLLAAQAALAVVLASFAPITVFMYASGIKYDAAKAFNGLLFLVASLAAQVVLRRAYGELAQRDRRHLVLLRGWLIVYAAVGIQMAWVLRPFIGIPGRPPTFFREGAWGNAYVEVMGAVWRALGG
jgi:hypothetical protein